MKRKKTEESTDPTKFWPIPGVDGEPYAPRVQEALDLVAKETLRRKRAECTHEDRMWITGVRENRYGNLRYRRACRDCHLVVACEHPEEGRRAKYARDDMVLSECRCGEITASRPKVKPRMQTPVYGIPYERRTDPMVSRQIKRAAERMTPYQVGQLQRSISATTEERDLERVKARNLARQALQAKLPQVISDPDRAPDLSWVRTMSGKQQLR